MNIFYTNKNPIESANDHCTIHTRKMIVEYAQMLSTAHRLLDGDGRANELNMYKTTHKHHPSNKWVRESKYHYIWLYMCFKTLCRNYLISTGKQHATDSKLLKVLEKAPINIPSSPFVAPPQCVPKHLQSKNTIATYKNYLLLKFKEWQLRNNPLKVNFLFTPEWINTH